MSVHEHSEAVRYVYRLATEAANNRDSTVAKQLVHIANEVVWHVCREVFPLNTREKLNNLIGRVYAQIKIWADEGIPSSDGIKSELEGCDGDDSLSSAESQAIGLIQMLYAAYMVFAVLGTDPDVRQHNGLNLADIVSPVNPYGASATLQLWHQEQEQIGTPEATQELYQEKIESLITECRSNTRAA